MHMSGSPFTFVCSLHIAAGIPEFLAMEHHYADLTWYESLIDGAPNPLIENGYATIPDYAGPPERKLFCFPHLRGRSRGSPASRSGRTWSFATAEPTGREREGRGRAPARGRASGGSVRRPTEHQSRRRGPRRIPDLLGVIGAGC